MNALQKRYQGYLDTPLLWNEGSLDGLTQFELHEQEYVAIEGPISDTIRLGKYVEAMVCKQFHRIDTINILVENLQIQDGKRTVGELDCLLTYQSKIFHIEIAYKFYLLDPSVSDIPLEQWIGPNRRDALVLKLAKLKEKQFPLLYSPPATHYLEALDIDPSKCVQRVLFKAQLFVPYNYHQPIEHINRDAVVGYYLSYQNMDRLSEAKFFIPRKLDWLIPASVEAPWISFSAFKQRLNEFIQKKSSPLVWVKTPKGSVQKVFVVWW